MRNYFVVFMVFIFFMLNSIAVYADKMQTAIDMIEKNNLSQAMALINKAPKLIKSQNKEGKTLLHFAAKSNDIDFLKFLVQKGASVTASDSHGRTPLHYAATSESNVTAEFFLSRGADINAVDNEGMTPLHYAALFNRKGCYDFLASKGAKKDIKDKKGRTPIALEQEMAPIHTLRNLAGRARWESIVDMINKNPKLVNAKDQYGCTPLHYAADWGRSDMEKFLVQKGANIEARDLEGGTPLHHAATWEHPAGVEYLISQGANINAVDNKGQTPLHCASYLGRCATVELLISKGAGINAKDKKGRTPLAIAKEMTKKSKSNPQRNYERTLKVLLKNGAK